MNMYVGVGVSVRTRVGKDSIYVFMHVDIY